MLYLVCLQRHMLYVITYIVITVLRMAKHCSTCYDSENNE